MNIGLFGGTFNPFHNGHIGIVGMVRQTFGLDRVFFIPSATPPHKPDVDLAPAADRFDMVEKSIRDIEGFFVSDKELKRKGPSFTIDTINEFKKEFGNETVLYLLMGSDAFLDITTWERKDEIFKAVRIIIMLRGETSGHEVFASFIDENISKGYTFSRKDNSFSHDRKQKIIICKVPRIDISSTLIRERVKAHLPIQGLVPEDVRKIIHEKELYQ